MLTKIYIHVEWWFSASKWSACHFFFCSTSKKDSLSAPWPCWSFGPAAHTLCTCWSSLVSLQPSVFVALTHLIGHHTVVFCVCSGKLCASWVVLMTCCSNDSSLRGDLGRDYLWENLRLWQILALERVGSKWEDSIRAILDSARGTEKQRKCAISFWPVDMARIQGSIRENQMDPEALL